MKKTIILSMALALCFATAGFSKTVEPETAPAPFFEGAENATVLDVVEVKKFDDRVRVINAGSDAKNFKIHIYRAKTDSWEFFGLAETKCFGDTDFVDSDKKAKKCRWVAITPIGGGDFKYQIRGDGTDLFITVLPKKELIDSALKAKAKVFEVASLDGGKFKDDVEVHNKSSNTKAAFSVFAFDNSSDAWTKIGDAELDGKGKEKTIYAPYTYSVANFKFFAIVAKDGKEYNYSAVVAKKNLVITAF